MVSPVTPRDDGSHSFPQLPSHASDTAVSVLNQLQAGSIPPEPPKPEHPDHPDHTFPDLPSQASSVAVSVHEQLQSGNIPPVPHDSTDSDSVSSTTRGRGRLKHVNQFI